MIYARKLGLDDAMAYRALRLDALRECGQNFGPTFEEESQYPDEYWKKRVLEHDGACLFGLFDEGRLIGALSARPWEKDPARKTALWTAAYVRPGYRGCGHSGQLYRLRVNWCQDRRYKQAVTWVFAFNRHGMDVVEKNGGQCFKEEMIEFTGRPAATARWYMTNLTPVLPGRLSVVRKPTQRPAFALLVARDQQRAQPGRPGLLPSLSAAGPLLRMGSHAKGI